MRIGLRSCIEVSARQNGDCDAPVALRIDAVRTAARLDVDRNGRLARHRLPDECVQKLTSRRLARPPDDLTAVVDAERYSVGKARREKLAQIDDAVCGTRPDERVCRAAAWHAETHLSPACDTVRRYDSQCGQIRITGGTLPVCSYPLG